MFVNKFVFWKKQNMKRHWLKYLYAFSTFFCCVWTVEQMGYWNITYSVGMACSVVCVISALCSHDETDRINRVFDRPWKKLLQILLELYGTFAMVGVYFLPSSIESETKYPAWIFFCVAFFWMHPIMKCLIAFLIKTGDAASFVPQKAELKTRLILMGIVLLPCMLSLIAFNPAITSPDSAGCFLTARRIWQPDFSMIDWQPPFYHFILYLLLQICDSVSFLIVCQCVCFAAVFVDGILFLYQCGFSKKALGIFYLFIALGTSNIIQLVTLWKDIPYMISLMWLTLLLMKRVMLSNQYADKLSWYIQFVPAVIFTAFFRQNGILPAVAVVVLLPIITKFSKKTVATSLLCVLLMVTVKGPLYQSMNVTPAPQLKFFSLSNDIMYSYYMGGSMSEEAMTLINKITENDPGDSADHPKWDPYWVLYNYHEPSGYSIPEFLKLYIHNFLENPKLAVKAVLTRNSVIWSLVRPTDENPSCICYLSEYRGEEGEDPNPDLYPARKENVLTDKLKTLYSYSTMPIFFLFYWRTGIYNLLLICMVVMMICGRGEKKIWGLIPFVPIFANLAALFISSGWTDYRYFWPSMSISLFLLFYFSFEWRKYNKSPECSEN